MMEILRSPDFDVVDYAAEYAKLEKCTGLAWKGLVDALHRIPLANEGSRHALLRRDFAQPISTRFASAKQAVADFLAETVRLVFKDRQRTELVRDLIQPANVVWETARDADTQASGGAFRVPDLRPLCGVKPPEAHPDLRGAPN
jgi:hypothetical protein